MPYCMPFITPQNPYRTPFITPQKKKKTYYTSDFTIFGRLGCLSVGSDAVSDNSIQLVIKQQLNWTIGMMKQLLSLYESNMMIYSLSKVNVTNKQALG